MLTFLVVASIWDMIRREIPVWYLVVGTGSVVIMQILGEKEEWHLLLFGGITGILFLLLSKATNQGIGYGDSWMILNLGLFTGIWKLCVILGIAFLGITIIAGLGVAGKVLKRKSRLPFLPFLLLGYLGVLGW